MYSVTSTWARPGKQPRCLHYFAHEVDNSIIRPKALARRTCECMLPDNQLVKACHFCNEEI
jgi:hypothetical protein